MSDFTPLSSFRRLAEKLLVRLFLLLLPRSKVQELVNRHKQPTIPENILELALEALKEERRTGKEVAGLVDLISQAVIKYIGPNLILEEGKVVETIFDSLPPEATQEEVLDLLSWIYIYMRDGGRIFDTVVDGWSSSTIPKKAYVAENFARRTWEMMSIPGNLVVS